MNHACRKFLYALEHHLEELGFHPTLAGDWRKGRRLVLTCDTYVQYTNGTAWT